MRYCRKCDLEIQTKPGKFPPIDCPQCGAELEIPDEKTKLPPRAAPVEPDSPTIPEAPPVSTPDEPVFEPSAEVAEEEPALPEAPAVPKQQSQASLKDLVTEAHEAGDEPEDPTSAPKLETFHKYKIVEKLGTGGMGVVYRARDPILNREIALKIFRPNLFEDPTYLVRFRREAEVAARLSHQNIAALYEFGIYNECPYFTMELVDGEGLSAVIQRMGRLPTRAALLIIRDCALALHYAHTQGVIHRDIKSANIQIRSRQTSLTPQKALDSRIELASGVTSEFQAVLLDFGLASAAGVDTKLTQAGDLVGTPSYMSPEQVSGRLGVVTPKSDVFSLGVVLYETLTGQLPFTGDELHVMLSKIESEDPAAPRTVVPAIHRDVEAIVLKALEKSPDRRYETAEELAQDIDRYLRGEGTIARPAGLGRKLVRRIKRHKHLILPPVASLILVAIVLLYFGVYVPMQRTEEERVAEIRLLQQTLFSKQRIEVEFRTAATKAQNLLEAGLHQECINLCSKIDSDYSKRIGTKFDHVETEQIDWRSEPRFQALKTPLNLRLAEVHLTRAMAAKELKNWDEARYSLALAYVTGSTEDAAVSRRALLDLGKMLLDQARPKDALEAFRKLHKAFPKAMQADEAAFLAATIAERSGNLAEALDWYKKAKGPGRLFSDQNSRADRSIANLEQWLPVLSPTIQAEWIGVIDVPDIPEGGGSDELITMNSMGWVRIMRLDHDGWTVKHEQPLLQSRVARTLAESSIPVRFGASDLDGNGQTDLIIATGRSATKTSSLAVYERDAVTHNFELRGAVRLGPGENALDFVVAHVGSRALIVLPSREVTGGLRVVSLLRGGLRPFFHPLPYAPPSIVAAAEIDDIPGDELIVSTTGENPGLLMLRWDGFRFNKLDRLEKTVRVGGLQVAHTDLLLKVEKAGRRHQDPLTPGLWTVPLEGDSFGEPRRIHEEKWMGWQALIGAHGLRGHREIIIAERDDQGFLSYRIIASASWGESAHQILTKTVPAPPVGWNPVLKVRAGGRPALLLPARKAQGWKLMTLGSGSKGRDRLPEPDRTGFDTASDKETEAIETIISLGLHREALKLCRRAEESESSGNKLALLGIMKGRCLQSMGRMEESMKTFQEAAKHSALLALDALMSLAAIQKEGGDYKGFRETLREILREHATDPYRAKGIQLEIEEVSDILYQEPRLVVGRQLRDEMMSDSAFHIRFLAEGSRIALRGDGRRIVRHAFPFRYDGATASISSSIKTLHADPGTRLVIELATVSAYLQGNPSEPGYVRMGLEIVFGPEDQVQGYSVFSDGEAVRVDQSLPKGMTRQVVPVELQILDVSQAAEVRVGDVRLRFPLPRDLPRGNYVAVIGVGGRGVDPLRNIKVELDQLRLNAGSKSLRTTRHDPGTLTERLLAARGRLAAGNPAAAADLLNRVMADPESKESLKEEASILPYMLVPLTPYQEAQLLKGLIAPALGAGNGAEKIRSVLSHGESAIHALAWLKLSQPDFSSTQNEIVREAVADAATFAWHKSLIESLEPARGITQDQADTLRDQLRERWSLNSIEHAILWDIHYLVDPQGTFTDFVAEGMQKRFRGALLVREVKPGSPAYSAGLLPGDLILSCDGAWLPDEETFTRTLEGGEGIKADIRVRRRGRDFPVFMRRSATGVVLVPTWAVVDAD